MIRHHLLPPGWTWRTVYSLMDAALGSCHRPTLCGPGSWKGFGSSRLVFLFFFLTMALTKDYEKRRRWRGAYKPESLLSLIYEFRVTRSHRGSSILFLTVLLDWMCQQSSRKDLRRGRRSGRGKKKDRERETSVDIIFFFPWRCVGPWLLCLDYIRSVKAHRRGYDDCCLMKLLQDWITTNGSF